jgi:hypothetical protein
MRRVAMRVGASAGVWAAAWAVLLILMTPAGASAATSYGIAGSFGSADLAGPSAVAVDDASGDVLVVDQAAGVVKVFSSGGPSATLITSFGAGELVSPYGIAIDQATHDAYVSDPGGGRIARYVSDGAPTPTYTSDLTYTSPSAGSGAGQIQDFTAALAVDPSDEDLVVADPGNRLVTRYTAAGAFVGSFDGSGASSSAFVSPSSVAVDSSGTTYVVDITGSPLDFPGGSSNVRGYTANGTPLPGLAVDTPRTVAYDTKTGNVVIAGRSQLDFSAPHPPRLYVFNGGNPISATDFPSIDAGGRIAGLAVDGTSGRLYAMATTGFGGGNTAVEVFEPFALPDVTLNAPTAVTAHGAHVSGTVNPLGVHATYRFEGSTDGSSWSSLATGDAGSGSVPTPVESDVVLRPNTEYQIRLVAENASGSIASGSRVVTTGLAPPEVQTGTVSDRTSDGATLHGSIDTLGQQTTYHFDFGTDSNYGARSPANHELVAGNGRTIRLVAVRVSGLIAGATYHYRLVAQNPSGQTEGADRTFVASPAATARGYELVSPTDKGGSNIDSIRGFQASESGEGLAYQAKTPLAGNAATEGAPLNPRYFGARADGGWTFRALDPPQDTAQAFGVFLASTLAVSRDDSKALVVSLRSLADGAVEGDSNLYLRDTTTGRYTTVATVPGRGFYNHEHGIGASSFVDGTRDFSHILLHGSGYSLLPGTPTQSLYEWTGNQLRLASVRPDGTAFPGASSNSSTRDHERYLISSDGSHVFFGGDDGAVYLRTNGATTALVSASAATGNVGTAQPAQFVGASADGAIVFLTGADLTDDSPAGEPTLYRYVVATQALSRVGAQDNVLQVSTDGLYAYFIRGADIKVWHANTVRTVATVDPALDPNGTTNYLASPSGRFLAFRAYTSLTGNDTRSTACNDLVIVGDPGGACSEIYRYDADSASLTCASCRTDGRASVGNPSIGPDQAEFGHHYPRSVLDDGRVFFDTPNPLAAADANSGRDVYSFDGVDASLVSAGKGSGDSQLADVDLDGKNVFFTTQDRLVGIDTDSLTDVYDARIDGGLAAQVGAATANDCDGEDCRSGGSSASSEPPASETSTGAARATQSPAPKAKIKLISASFTGTSFTTRVSVSGPGRIRVSGTVMAATLRVTSKAGIYRVVGHLDQRHRAARRAGRAVKAKVKITFTPTFGTAAITSVTRTAKR